MTRALGAATLIATVALLIALAFTVWAPTPHPARPSYTSGTITTPAGWVIDVYMCTPTGCTDKKG